MPLPCSGQTLSDSDMPGGAAASLCSSRACPQQPHIYGLHSAQKCLNNSSIQSDALGQPRVPGSVPTWLQG